MTPAADGFAGHSPFITTFLNIGNYVTQQQHSSWPHWWAVLLCATAFPLIWVGGLVTTHDAGMAVPDWPTTYGYNLFLYPWQSWLFGPWDLFVEHGHRLLGAAVGLITLATACAVWRAETNSLVRGLAIALACLVVFQGVLGGLRVRLDARWLAQLHACVGPAFFALCVTMFVVTSRSWKNMSRTLPSEGSSGINSAASLALLLAYLQIVLGSFVRHASWDMLPALFRATVVLHVVLGIGLAGQASYVAWRVLWRRTSPRPQQAAAIAVVALLAAQLALGVAAWTVNYGLPFGWGQHGWLAGHLVTARGAWQSLLTTAHQANGSLILGTTTLIALFAWRESWNAGRESAPSTAVLNGATS